MEVDGTKTSSLQDVYGEAISFFQKLLGTPNAEAESDLVVTFRVFSSTPFKMCRMAVIFALTNLSIVPSCPKNPNIHCALSFLPIPLMLALPLDFLAAVQGEPTGSIVSLSGFGGLVATEVLEFLGRQSGPASRRHCTMQKRSDCTSGFWEIWYSEGISLEDLRAYFVGPFHEFPGNFSKARKGGGGCKPFLVQALSDVLIS
ncbi:hypothetical protein Nepgr_005983 [Nepenthes gracilis]|uniref:Uncharacterized protein n=1 Tax=Nepenthes gracilis TaxID=150966 RepID=A0AAD3S473_NEPGR|nr:hypothetical protein Nepgr_005983 [Nepenthes gracilis]